MLQTQAKDLHHTLFTSVLYNTSMSQCPRQGHQTPNNAVGCGRGVHLYILAFITRDSAHKS